jgi:spermidine/putrescine transport system ATP-binding protein
VVRAILFDGANSRLLANPLKSDKEILIALPQNRQYDHIKVNDRIEIGWDPGSGICFPDE